MDRMELQNKLREVREARESGDLSDKQRGVDKNWRILRGVLGIIWPQGLEAAKRLSQSFLLDGYEIGLREALGKVNEEGLLDDDLRTVGRLKDRLIERYKKPAVRTNPWLDPETYETADWHYVPGLGRVPHWH